MLQTRPTLSRITGNNFVLLSLFWVGVLAVNAPAWKAGFVAEFLQMFFDIDRISFSDFIHRRHAAVKSLYQFTQLQLYVWIRLFGTHFLPWYLLLSLFHALNGLLGFLFFQRLFDHLGLKSSHLISLGGILLFLFNPNITEVTIWKGGYHYLTSVMMQLGILLCVQQFLLHGKQKYVWWSIGLFTLSIFSLEIFYLTPALVLALMFAYFRAGRCTTALFRQSLVKIFLPLLLLFLFHLVLFRLVYGGWLAHYGVTGEMNLTPSVMFPRMVKYLMSLLLMAAHLPEKTRFLFFDWASLAAVSYGLVFLSAFVLLFIAWRFRNLRPSWKVAGFLIFGLVAGLVLVSPVYFDEVFTLYNSRRSYQVALFLYMLFSLSLFSVFNRGLASILFGLFLFICGALAFRKALHWKTASELQYTLLQKMGSDNHPVLLLNLPTYYKDVRTFAAGNNNEFNRQMMLFHRDSIKQVIEVSSYNMVHSGDGAHVTVIDSQHIKVTLNQWGTWWLMNYQGAGSYENEWFKVTMTDPGHEYLLTLKAASDSAELYFQQGFFWRKVNRYQPGEQH